MSFAFFDWDNTIIHGDAGPLFGNYLLRHRYEKIREEEGQRAAQKDQAKMAARYLPYMTWMTVQTGLYKTRALRRSQLVRSAFKALKGIDAKEYYGLMNDFVDEHIKDRIYPEMAQILSDHEAAGRKCIIITTGVEELVRRSLKHLPVTAEVIGGRLEEKDGKLTGGVDGPLYGADKANIIRAYCQSSDVDPMDCYAYSDHYSDYHMLEAVGHAVCINPRSRLLQLAQERAWDVLTPAVPEAA